MRLRLFVIGSLSFFVFGQAESFAQGIDFGSKNQKNLFPVQTKVLDTRAQTQYSNSVRLQPKNYDYLTNTGPAYGGTYNGPYLAMARAAANRYGVPSDLFLRLVQQESAWKPTARSHAGAHGLAQLMPATAKALGVDRKDPFQNLDGGAKYLRQQYDRFGSWCPAL